MESFPSVKIVGIEVRTSNASDGSNAIDDISKLWQQFYAQDIINQVQHKINNDVYAIYTDYVSNYQAEYTTYIGVAVSSFAEQPDGLIAREFPAQNMRKFTVTGELPDAVLQVWNYIWQHDASLNRTYSYDFELYKTNNSDALDVEIYLAVKP